MGDPAAPLAYLRKSGGGGQAVEQIRMHENKLAEIDYMIPECGDPDLRSMARP